VDEMIRDAMHHALDPEPTPAGLRWRVIDAVPMHRERRSPLPRLRSQWAAGLVAALLALAIVVGLMYTRGLLPTQVHPRPVPIGTSLLSPEGVAIGPDGSVYVSDYVAGLVFRIDPNGRAFRFAGGGTGTDGPATEAHLQHLVGVAVDQSGNVYVAEAFHGHSSFASNAPGDIKRIDRRGQISTFAQGGGLLDPNGLAIDSVGTLYFSDYGGNVGSLDRFGNPTWLEGPSVGPPVPSPGYMAFDAKGNLYISDRAPSMAGAPGGCRILRMTPDKVFSIVAGTGTCGFTGDGGPATRAEINDPNGIAFDAGGNLYFSDANNHRVRRIDSHGVITTVAGTGVPGSSGDNPTQASKAQLGYPFGLAISTGGFLYISDASCSCDNPAVPGNVRMMNLANGLITTVLKGGIPFPAN
jgi:sugar lactone lactonase YvrE